MEQMFTRMHEAIAKGDNEVIFAKQFGSKSHIITYKNGVDCLKEHLLSILSPLNNPFLDNMIIIAQRLLSSNGEGRAKSIE